MTVQDQDAPSAVAMTIGEVGLLHIRSRPEVDFTIIEAQEALNWAGQLTGNQPKPFLVNLSGTSRVSVRVFRHLATNVTPSEAVALAVVVDSFVVANIGRVVWGLNQPKIPMRVYTTTSEAMEWLTGHRLSLIHI